MYFLCLIAVLLSAFALGECRTRHHTHIRKHDVTKPNIVLILTDDQDLQLGGMTPLVKTKKLIASHGITFTNAFASTPICCPSRSSILTGRYQHNHGVVNNSLAGNCNSQTWQQGPEHDTFAVYLKQANYTTAYFGKYLNKYGNEKSGGVGHIPPGWDHWSALVGNSKYYNYTLSTNGKEEIHYDDPLTDYLTDVIAKKAEEFLTKFDANSGAFFMILAPPACHAPFTPHPVYRQFFAELKAPRTPNFNVSNGLDKHWLLRHSPEYLSENVIDYIDEVFRNRWRTLLSVDDMVERTIETLQERNLLDNTYVIFTSDHGYHLGQFSLPIDKRQAYEFDIRIPLMIRGPRIQPGQLRKEVVVTIDLAPTIVHLAGISHPSTMDGKSLVPLFFSDDHAWRLEFLIEYHGEGYYGPMPKCPDADYNGMANCFPSCICEDAVNNTYSCIRSFSKNTDMIYCEFDDTEKFIEMYDLNNDPHQMTNIASQNPDEQVKNQKYWSEKLQKMKTCRGPTCFET